jgi:hypothetical protein
LVDLGGAEVTATDHGQEVRVVIHNRCCGVAFEPTIRRLERGGLL